MSNCRSGCDTGGHETWGECVRAARLQVGDLKGRTVNRSWDRELDAYEGAVRQGIEPANTTLAATQAAVAFADQTGIGDPWAA